jgi:hypothetical protein
MSENGLDRDTALAVVDEALASGRVTADDAEARELQDLALALEAESELPDEAYARELGERVAAGFPRAARRRPAFPPFLRGRALALTGAAASLLVVIGVALSVSGSGEGDDEPRATALEAAPQSAPPPGDSRLREAGPGAATVAPDNPGAGRGVAPREPRRRIERSAELTLAAPEDRLERVADQIIRVTDRHGGFVLRSSVSTGDDSDEGGTFDLRIPAASLQAALGDLSKLGNVRSRRQSGQDVTPLYVSARDRLTTAKAERRSLLRRLEAADTDAEAEAIRRRLDAVNMRIERLRRELGALRDRTDYAAVSVELEPGGDSGGGAGGGTGEAFDDAVGLLEGSLNLALRALGVLIPVGIVAGLGWLGGRILRRRRREAALR